MIEPEREPGHGHRHGAGDVDLRGIQFEFLLHFDFWVFCEFHLRYHSGISIIMDAYCNNEEGELALEGEVHLEAGILTWDMNKLYGIDGKEFKSDSF